MPRAPKQCGAPNCTTRITGRTYCDTHRAEHQRRDNTTARGYGATHQHTRAAWAPHVATGTINCWRCGQPITPTDEWHLGHDDHNRTITRGPEHARRCNLAAAGAKKKEKHPQAYHPSPATPTLTEAPC